ncbi:hypothetical protein [Terriglobus aquaticus]|uniref:Uncharacterized protein n=1 Tax=Terriglobus aquaticus TaxID=940139 RepID=A0ABW9KML0_9BACT|nr:hypothetical protein [Terriglobus aquaticus]
MASSDDANGAFTAHISASCDSAQHVAIAYFTDHHLYSGTQPTGAGFTSTTRLRNEKLSLLPSGKALFLDRYSIRKYSVRKVLSPFRSFDNFQLAGQFVLSSSSAGGCDASLAFRFSAYTFVWPLAAIDDGYRTAFESNGKLERLYLEALIAKVEADKQ